MIRRIELSEINVVIAGQPSEPPEGTGEMASMKTVWSESPFSTGPPRRPW
jgi:hypothetical protein